MQYTGPIKSGERRGIATEFKRGRMPENKLPVGAVRIRQQRGDAPRAWVKVSEPNGWMPRAVWVWIEYAGPIPNGFVVHHLDGDTLHDTITNLALVIRAAHPGLHREQFKQAQAGQTIARKDICCSKCGGTFQGKYQRANSLCDKCKSTSRRESKRRYKQRIRSKAR